MSSQPVTPTLTQHRWFSTLRPESRRAHLDAARKIHPEVDYRTRRSLAIVLAWDAHREDLRRLVKKWEDLVAMWDQERHWQRGEARQHLEGARAVLKAFEDSREAVPTWVCERCGVHARTYTNVEGRKDAVRVGDPIPQPCSVGPLRPVPCRWKEVD